MELCHLGSGGGLSLAGTIIVLACRLFGKVIPFRGRKLLSRGVLQIGWKDVLDKLHSIMRRIIIAITLINVKDDPFQA